MFMIILNMLMAFVGWAVVHYLSIKREKDKERRALGSQTINHLEKLEEDALNYHANSDRLESSEQAILRALTQINRQLARMHLNESIANRMIFNAVKKAITIHNFQTSDFKQQEEDSSIFKDISFSISQLIGLIDIEITKIS